MAYKNLRFPILKDRPYFYTNFVSTIDGKVQVTSNPHAYWPIGSPLDYQTLVEIRAASDVLIHGRNTAQWMRHVDNLVKPEFISQREKLGKAKNLAYMVLSNNPDNKLLENISHPSVNTFLVTSEAFSISNLSASSNLPNPSVLKFGKSEVDLKMFSDYLFRNGYRNVLIEGGPVLLGSFLALGFLDEVFLTIAPKIFGNKENQTLTMVEGHLFPPDKVKNLKLISCMQIKDEVYLRYKILDKPE